MKNTFLLITLLLMSLAIYAQNKSTIFDNATFATEPAQLIQSVAGEISPVFIEDSIIFTGVDEEYFKNNKRDKKNPGFYNMYSAAIDKEGNISSTRKSVPELGNDYNEGPADYCEATGELFITLNNVNDFDKVQKMVPVENLNLQIAIMKKIDGTWKLIKTLPFNKKFHFAQPAISVSGDTLIFSSNMKPNFGKTDLFMSIRTDQEWSAPVNLGSNVNTSGNELFPTFILGNILSFASNGHIENTGGLDIYYSIFPELNEINTLNPPINTPYDDFGLKVHQNKSVGYFTSNRENKNSDDIYKLDIQRLNINLSGRIVESETNTPIANAALIFSMCSGGTINTVLTDPEGYFSNEVLSNECINVEIIADGYESKTANITGNNSLNFSLKQKQIYEIVVLDAETKIPVENVMINDNNEINQATNGNGLVSLTYPLPDSCKFMIQKNGYLKNIQTPKASNRQAVTRDTVFLFKHNIGTIFFRKNIYTNTGEIQILHEATFVFKDIVELLQLNPSLIVELGWHSDSRGSYNENLSLTRDRALFAVRYFERNGIAKNRVVARGYGESKILNRCKDGFQCTEEQHAVNRRIELKIIGFINSN